MDVDGGGVAPNGYDDDFRSRTACFDHGVQYFVDAGAFECDIYAFAVGQFFHFFNDIDFGWVEDVVGHAGFACFVFTCFAQFGDDDFDAFGFQYGSQQQTDWACAADQCDVAFFRATAYISMVADRQRLNQSGLVQWDFVGNRVYPTAFNGNFFRQAATAAAQADEVHVFGEMVVAAFTGRYVVADDVGFNDNVLADFDVVHAFAYGINHAGELVTHGYRG